MSANRSLYVALTFLLLCGADSSSSHGSIFVPPSLNPGDTYHLAFVTSGTHNALSTDITVYNDFVQAQAALNPSVTGTDMGVTWR